MVRDKETNFFTDMVDYDDIPGIGTFAGKSRVYGRVDGLPDFGIIEALLVQSI